MAGETVITVVGNLTADPELRATQGGLSVAGFTIASTPRTFDRQANEWKDGDALFLRCNAWRELGEHVAASLTKGMRVIATGNLGQRSYKDREGNDRISIELDVQEIGPSLKYATAQVTRATPGGGQQAAQQPNAPQQGYGAPQQGYGPPQGAPQAPQQQYQQPQQGYPAPGAPQQAPQQPMQQPQQPVQQAPQQAAQPAQQWAPQPDAFNQPPF